jgi:ABC-2 type transport system permease protein/fluoroquinolone transport system permease protein
MKRFFSMFMQDLILAYRNGLILVTGILLIVMVALVLFLPKQLKVHNEMILDLSQGSILATYLNSQGVGEGVVFIDEQEFNHQLEKQPNKVGVIFSGDLVNPMVELITNSQIPVENINLLKASLDRAILDLRGESSATIPVIFLRGVMQTPAFNLKIIPVALVFEVVLLGFFFVSVMMFQEKQEATLRAYRVTPAGVWNYILSKNLLFIVLSIAYGLPLLLVGFGLSINYGLILVLVILTASMMTLISLFIAVFFRNLSEWFFVGVAVLVINSLPSISYGIPSFSPAWMRWIPSYPAVFAVRDVLFNTATWVEVQPTIILLVILNGIGLLLAYLAIQRKLLKEG